MKKVKLSELAHARFGEKGDAVNVAVVAYREEPPDEKHSSRIESTALYPDPVRRQEDAGACRPKFDLP